MGGRMVFRLIFHYQYLERSPPNVRSSSAIMVNRIGGDVPILSSLFGSSVVFVCILTHDFVKGG